MDFNLILVLMVLGLAIQDFQEAKKHEGVGYVSNWALLVLLISTFVLQFGFLLEGIIFVIFWIINNILISKLTKKPMGSLMGIGDYPVLFTIGTFIIHPTSFMIFIVVNASVFFLLYKKGIGAFLPSAFVGLLAVIVYNNFFL